MSSIHDCINPAQCCVDISNVSSGSNSPILSWRMFGAGPSADCAVQYPRLHDDLEDIKDWDTDHPGRIAALQWWSGTDHDTDGKPESKCSDNITYIEWLRAAHIVPQSCLPTLGQLPHKSDDAEGDFATRLDFQGTSQATFEGVGALSGGGGTSRYLYDYDKVAQQQILDNLFSPEAGALQILKIEIGGDTWSTQATEPSHQHTRHDLNCSRGYEWKIAKAAKRRNPSIQIYGLSWGLPGWIGNGTNFFSQDNIEYQTAWLQCMREAHGLEVNWIGLANERPLQPTGEYVAAFREHLDSHGFAGVKIVGGDDTGWKVVDNVMQDSKLFENLDRVSSHYPLAMGGYLSADKRSQLAAKGASRNHSLPLWASEDWTLSVQTADWKGALRLAEMLNRNVVQGGITCSIIWNLLFAWNYLFGYAEQPSRGEAPFGGQGHGLFYAAEPWSGHWQLRPALFAVMHTSQFSSVGDKLPPRAMGVLPNGTGSFVTYYTNDSAWSLVIETANASSSSAARNVQFSLNFRNAANGVPQQLRCWRSTEGEMMAEIAPVAITAHGDGTGFAMKMNLRPSAFYSCSTYKVGSMPKVQRSAATSAAFPMKYEDNFEDYQVRSMVRYLTAEGGIFETAESPDVMRSSGKLALKQILTEKPIPWYSDPLPFATLGDPSPSRWQNYTVSASVFTPASASAKTVPVTVVMDACNGSEAQAWTWRAIPTKGHRREDTVSEAQVPVGQWIAKGSGENAANICLGRSGSSMSAAGVAAPTVAVVSCDSSDLTQQWYLVNQTNGTGPAAGQTVNQLASPSAAGRCLDVWGPYTKPDTPVDLWPCRVPARSNQQWYTTPTGSSGAVHIHSAFDGQCLTVQKPQSSASGTVPFAMVCGRISSYDSCRRGAPVCAPPHGYCLQLLKSGAWKLFFGIWEIGSGAVAAETVPQAHRLALTFVGRRLTASIDGDMIVDMDATNSTGGMIALGSGRHVAFFDDLLVEPNVNGSASALAFKTDDDTHPKDEYKLKLTERQGPLLKASVNISIIDHGAVCDGVTPDTHALGSAFAAASAAVHAGAETVVVRVPADHTCLTGPFNLTSNRTILYLELNSTLRALDDEALWPQGYPLPTYGPDRLFSGFVGLYNVMHSGITGPGSLDMNGHAWHGGRLDKKNDYKNLPHFVIVHGSSDILLQDVTLLNGRFPKAFQFQ